MISVSPAVTHEVTAVASTSMPSTMPQPTPSVTSSGSTPFPTNPGRAPP